jgi:hypothetical protein
MAQIRWIPVGSSIGLFKVGISLVVNNLDDDPEGKDFENAKMTELLEKSWGRTCKRITALAMSLPGHQM